VPYSLSLLRAHGVVIPASPSTINGEPSEQKTSGGIKKNLWVLIMMIIIILHDQLDEASQSRAIGAAVFQNRCHLQMKSSRPLSQCVNGTPETWSS
jgi:hypothetical protein